MEVMASGKETEMPQVSPSETTDRGPDASNTPETERDEKSPDALAEKHEKALMAVSTAKAEAEAMHKFMRDYYGDLALKEFGPEKVAKTLEHLANNATAEQPINLHNVTPLQFISLLSEDSFQAAEFFGKAENYFKQKDAINLDQSNNTGPVDTVDPNTNASHTGFYIHQAKADREVMRLQSALDYVGLTGIGLHDRGPAREPLYELSSFESQQSERPDFTALVEQVNGAKSLDSHDLQTHFLKNVEEKQKQEAAIKLEFDTALVAHIISVEEQVENKFGAKREELLKKLEIQVKFQENQESPVAQEQFKTIVELTAKEYEATLKAVDRLREKLMAPWKKAQQKVEKWRQLKNS